MAPGGRASHKTPMSGGRAEKTERVVVATQTCGTEVGKWLAESARERTVTVRFVESLGAGTAAAGIAMIDSIQLCAKLLLLL